MPRKAAQTPEAAPFRWKPSNRTYEWHEMPAEDGDEDAPLRVQLQRLTVAEHEAIVPKDEKQKTANALGQAHQHITAWNLTAENIESGKIEPVPPPAELGEAGTVAAVEALLTINQAQWLYRRLLLGHALKVQDEKKALRLLGDTPESPNGRDSAAAS